MVAKRAGQFAGGFLNNPGALAAIGIVVSIITTLVIFRNDIRDFFGGISEGFGNIDITLPTISFPEITFPTFELPSFELPSFELPSFEDIFMVPAPEPVGTEIDIALSEGATVEDIQNIIGIDPDDPNQDPTKFLPPVPEEGDPDFIGPIQPDEPFMLPEIEPAPIPLPDPISPITGFGGPSFEGGTIFETPIENLSLNQIIEMGLAETASEAANLLAIAQGFTPEEEAFLGQQGTIGGISVMEPTGPAVSDPTVAGLTPEEIFAQLFGSVQNPEFGA